MLLSYMELCELIDDGVLENSEYENVNSASIDLTLGNHFKIEVPGSGMISYSRRDPIDTLDHFVRDGEVFVLDPGEFCLAQTKEVFNLPNWLSGEYKLKSSMARIGLEHLNAGWCDAGWHGSVLTLEFKNMSNYHSIQLSPGDKIGQIVFFRHEPVPADRSYAVRGRYNQDKKVSGIKE